MPLGLLAALVIAVLILAWLAGVALHIFALVAIFVNLLGLLALLAVATWVVASVWKGVMRR